MGYFQGESIYDLSDVGTAAGVVGNILQWGGSSWLDVTLATAGISVLGHDHDADYAPLDLSYVPKSGAYTLLATDDIIACNASGGTFTLTLPAASGNTGKLYHIQKTDSSANVVTIDGAAAETIDGAATVTLDVQWHALTIVCDGSNWLVV